MPQLANKAKSSCSRPLQFRWGSATGGEQRTAMPQSKLRWLPIIWLSSKGAWWRDAHIHRYHVPTRARCATERRRHRAMIDLPEGHTSNGSNILEICTIMRSKSRVCDRMGICKLSTKLFARGEFVPTSTLSRVDGEQQRRRPCGAFNTTTYRRGGSR